MRRSLLLSGLATMVLVVGSAGGLASAAEHDHGAGTTQPAAPTERQHHTVDLAAPAVAAVRTSADLDVVIHDGGLKRVHYKDVPIGGGSAVAVNANGVLVTSDATVALDRAATVRRGVNLAFHDIYGVPLPADPSAEMELTDEALHHRLHDCYAEAPDADCAVFPTLATRVTPYVTSPEPEGQPATVIDTEGPLALLRIGGANNPTAGIAAGTPTSEQSVVAIGFSGAVEAGTKPVTIGTKIMVDGPNVSLDDAEMIREQLGSGWSGGAVVDLQTAQLVGLIAGDPTAPQRVLPAFAVSAALKNVPISPLRSAVDSDYAAALDYFFAHHYSHSINDFQAVLRLNPQHALAAVHLQQSKDAAGKPGDLSTADDLHPASDDSSSSSWAWWTGLGLLLLVAAAVAAALILRRRRAGGTTVPFSGPVPYTPASARMRTAARRLLNRPTRDGTRSGTIPPEVEAVAGQHAAPTTAPNGLPPQAGAPYTRSVDVRSVGVPVGVGGPAMSPSPSSPGATDPRPARASGDTTAPRPAFCEQCGSHLGGNARFCGQCAAPVGH